MKRIVLIFVIAIPVLLLAYCLYYPQKVAIKESDLSEGKGDYIICEPCLVTGFEWQIVKSTIGYEGYVFVEGELSNVHTILKKEVTSNNRFVLYGRFVGEKNFYSEGKFPVFQSESWDILTPVKRNTGLPEFFNLSYGLTWLDFYHY